MFGHGKGRSKGGGWYVTDVLPVDSQGRRDGPMNALNERQEKLRRELEKRRQALRTEASSATTSDSTDPITETPAKVA